MTPEIEQKLLTRYYARPEHQARREPPNMWPMDASQVTISTDGYRTE